MKSWVLAVGLLAAATSGGAMAADLDDGPYDRNGSAYDDPRYSDIYRYPDTRHPVPREPVYGHRYETMTATTTARRAATPTPIRAPIAAPACRASRSSIA